MAEQSPPPERTARLQHALRKVILLRETGPKSAAWHRARMQTIWRLHRLLEREPPPPSDLPPE